MSQDNNYSIKTIIETDNPKLLIDQAKKLAKEIKSTEATRTQVRSLFGTLRKIEMSWPTQIADDQEQQQLDGAYRQLILLMPRLAYVARKHPELIEFTKTLQAGIEHVKKDDLKTFKRMMQFSEAVVAYFFS